MRNDAVQRSRYRDKSAPMLLERAPAVATRCTKPNVQTVVDIEFNCVVQNSYKQMVKL
jgi:hypothetical protein